MRVYKRITANITDNGRVAVHIWQSLVGDGEYMSLDFYHLAADAAELGRKLTEEAAKTPAIMSADDLGLPSLPTTEAA